MKTVENLYQVSSFVGEKVAAGGHQGYAALGGLYTQARPMVPHLYGDLYHQSQQIPVSTIQVLSCKGKNACQ